MSAPKVSSLSQTPARSREQKRLETRERIYEAALAEFIEVGFQKAQIDRIVERAGVARGTFYFHFPTKEHVLLELQRREESAATQRIAEGSRSAENLSEYLHQLMNVLTSESVRAKQEHPELMREMLAMYVRTDIGTVLTDQSLVVHVVDYLSDAAERGAVRRDIPPEQLAVHFLSAMFVHFMDSADAERADEFANTKIELLVRGMAP